MSTCLVVANQTLPTEQLAAAIRQKIADGFGTFYVVVPLTATGGRLTWDETDAVDAAEDRLDRFITAVKEHGADAAGEVGDQDPIQAVRDAMRNHPADEILLSTLPTGISRWLQMDVPSRLSRSVEIPVTVVTQEVAVGV